MTKLRRFDPQLDELLQRTHKAIRRSLELIDKAKQLQQRAKPLRKGKRQQSTA